MRQIGVLTSGGDTPGMNAAIRAVTKAGMENGVQVYGVFHGYQGLCDGNIRLLTEADIADMMHRGGTILKTGRSEEFRTKEGAEKARRAIRAFGLDALIVIGGDGSLSGAKMLAEQGISVMGIPGTIDNDLAYTQYTIGFDSAVNNVVEQVYKIRDTMASHDRVGVIEVMGNSCGDIALLAGAACGAEAIIMPEVPLDMDALCDKLNIRRIRGIHTGIIIVAEGAGKGVEIAKELTERTEQECRAIVLGYIQRGGRPSYFDRILATRCGELAVRLLVQGQHNRVIGMVDHNMVHYDIFEAMEMKPKFDMELYNIAMMMSSV